MESVVLSLNSTDLLEVVQKIHYNKYYTCFTDTCITNQSWCTSSEQKLKVKTDHDILVCIHIL